MGKSSRPFTLMHPHTITQAGYCIFQMPHPFSFLYLTSTLNTDWTSMFSYDSPYTQLFCFNWNYFCKDNLRISVQYETSSFSISVSGYNFRSSSIVLTGMLCPKWYCSLEGKMRLKLQYGLCVCSILVNFEADSDFLHLNHRLPISFQMVKLCRYWKSTEIFVVCIRKKISYSEVSLSTSAWGTKNIQKNLLTPRKQHYVVGMHLFSR